MFCANKEFHYTTQKDELVPQEKVHFFFPKIKHLYFSCKKYRYSITYPIVRILAKFKAFTIYEAYNL